MMTSMVLAFLASHNSADELEKFGKQQDALSKEKEQAKDEALKAGSGSGSAVGSAMMGSAGSAMLGSGTTPDLRRLGRLGDADPRGAGLGRLGDAREGLGRSGDAGRQRRYERPAAKAAAMGATTGSAAKAAPRASGIQPADPRAAPAAHRQRRARRHARESADRAGRQRRALMRFAKYHGLGNDFLVVDLRARRADAAASRSPRT